MELYKLEKVTKVYQQTNESTHALDCVDLKINDGEIIVVLGPSGSGKSTMLNILSGIDNPSNGKVYFKDKRIDCFNEKELTDYRKTNLGFIFQSYNLISNLNVFENVELGRELANNPLNLKELLNLVGLEEHMKKYPYQLSGGQMQRVAIARALVKNPHVLFCDEPTGALDEKTGKVVLSLLQEINREYNTTIIIVTHNPSIALMANTVIKMNSGQIISVTKNKEIISALDLRWA